MSERNYYVICDDNCRFPAMTKEETLAAITEAIETGEITDVDTGFVTTLKEQNKNTGLKFWIGTQAEYNALRTKAINCFYIITDDLTKDSILSRITALEGAPLKNRVLWEGSAEEGDVIIVEDSRPSDYQLFAFVVNKNDEGELGQKTILAFRTPGEEPTDDFGSLDFAEFNGIHFCNNTFYNYYGRVMFETDFSDNSEVIHFAKGFSATLPNITGSGSLYIKKIIGIY